MDYSCYEEKVLSNYGNVSNIVSKNDFSINIFYNEKFDWSWFGTKLKTFGFLSYSEVITEEILREYSKECFKYARKNYKGLPRGIQNGFCSFSVLASSNIKKDALAYVNKKSKMHFSAFEISAIYDLQTKKLHYCSERPIWGALYYEYFMEYLNKHFNV